MKASTAPGDTRPHLVLPTLIGARSSAIDLVADLPGDLADLEVTVDASLCLSASQGFADELVKQVLEVRGAASLAVGESSAAFAKHLRRSADLRGFAGRVFIDSREI
jgi:hypothetical protein